MSSKTRSPKKKGVKPINEVIDLTTIKPNTSRKSIPKPLRRQVWDYYMGQNYSGKCKTGCGKIIDVFDYECGHVVSVKNGGGNILDNLKPICSSCNKSMGTQNLIEFGLVYYKYDPMEMV